MSSEKLEQSTVVKEQGTVGFQEGKYKQALLRYKKIVSWLELELTFSNEDGTEGTGPSAGLAPQPGMCHVKRQALSAAAESCKKALELHSNHEKGLFRQGEAHLAVNGFDLARADFQKVLQLYPSRKAAKAQQQIRKELEWEKKLYDNIFERLAGEESKAKATVAAGDQPADTEVKDGLKNRVAGGQPQVEAEVWPCPALLPAACPPAP